MSGPFEGVRVIEIAAWTFVPGAGAIMADLGADVIKVEPPTGDPQRGLMNMLNSAEGGPNPFVELPNRGKRSITLDLSTEGGRDILLRLAATADVLLTSYLPSIRAKLRIDVDDLRAVNPRIIYVRGSGWGSRGPMKETGGFDSAAGFSSSGMLHKLTPAGAEDPVIQPAAFVDLQGANSLAGAVAMALFRRERTGESAVVDVSLLNTGMWTMGPDIVAAPHLGGEIPRPERRAAPNPVVNYYRTKDDRWINVVLLQADRFWAEFCTLIERPDLITDARYADAAARFMNRAECVAELDAVFAARTLAEWKTVLAPFTGVWAPALTPAEVHEHAQVRENEYLPEVTGSNGRPFRLVAPPYQFDDEPGRPTGPAPELGQHTEEVLLDLGLDWDDIAAARDKGHLG